jgi:alkylhydroperoxidase/carboxymuconolactone decarboxylase family protein YurZ
MDEATKARLKAEVVATRRYWAPFHEGLLERDPAFLEAYLGFLHGPWRRGALAPKVREFIYVAADLSCAHLYATGAKRHMQFAMEAGATPDELLEVACLEDNNDLGHLRDVRDEYRAAQGQQ